MTKYRFVRFTSSFRAFTGVDLAVYGPFEAGDVARLPAANAESVAGHRKVAEVIRGGS